MTLDTEENEGGLIKCTKIESNPFSLSVMRVDTAVAEAYEEEEETKDEEKEYANFDIDAVQEILPVPECA